MRARIRKGATSTGWGVQSSGLATITREARVVKIGVLIIGSLYWDGKPPRPGWRAERLDCMHKEHVKAPIRYGRQSSGYGNAYTMVFSPGLCVDKFGTAIAVPCGSQNLIEEADWLWAAEDKSSDGPTDSISAGYGCVALLENPDLHLPDEVREEWTDRVAREKDYGNLIRVNGEDDVVDTSGFLKISWPRTETGSPLEWNALIATANSPRGSCLGYPKSQKIADAWNTPAGREAVGYFWNNRKHGITTHQDARIEAQLEKLDLTP